MPLSSATLSAIQKAGAAVFAADTQLRNATLEYADRVKAALGSNPLNLDNDALFENWKTVARLSQTISSIEQEITKVFHAASGLMAHGQPVQSLASAKPKRAVNKSAAPQTERPMARASVKAKKPVAKPASRSAALEAARSLAPAPLSLAATPAAEAGKTRTSKPKARAAKAPTSPQATRSAKPVKVAKRASQAGARPEISGNAAKLLNYLERVLNTQDFSALSQTAAAKEIDIPLGSMTAALKKLMESARLIAGPAGSYKLVSMPAASPQ